jgi:hypothetical protein
MKTKTKVKKKVDGTKRMLDPSNIAEHIGDTVKYRKRLNELEPLETYFRKRCKEVGIEFSYDCTANENTHFNTLNYTTYAGMFIMHPLTFDVSLYQMFDAKADNCESVGHIQWVRNNIKNKQAGKYTKGNGSELEAAEYLPYESVMVIAGQNKFYQHTSQAKFKELIKRYGSKLLIKPHPLTGADIIGEVFENKGMSQLANKHDDLYAAMAGAKKVYTTHISETALTAAIMGKEISPIDPWGVRKEGSFSHINHFLFSYPNNVELIDSMFASYKSGVVHPEVDANWKEKIDMYIDYSMQMREIQKGHYYE